MGLVVNNNKFFKRLISILCLILPLLLSACGGGSTSNDPIVVNNTPTQSLPTKSKTAISIIARYAQNGLVIPKLFDYKEADVTGVIASNINIINQEVRKLGKRDLLDTREKIQNLVNMVLNRPPTASQEAIRINEVLAANTHTNMDTDFYAFSDWIELTNVSNKTLDIGGYYLSDDNNNPMKWMIPLGTKVAAQSFILVWADKKDRKVKELHANFKLSKKGETVSLANRKGNVIDTITFTQQVSDISVSKINKKLTYLIPTPKKINSKAFMTKVVAKSPAFSYKSGFYDSVLNVVLSYEGISTASTEIYYTTDGSQPSKSSKKYNQTIAVTKTTVIRAISFEKGKLPSTTISNTYFINHQTTLPVVSLSTDKKYLFDDAIGIHTDGVNGVALKQCNSSETVKVNYANDWERPVQLSYFDSNHTEQFSFGADLSITGQCSRKFPKKSLAFELNSKYGVKTLKKKLYPNKDLGEIKDFKLRMGNQGFEIGDILAASIVESAQLDIDYQAYRAIQLFMNGEYWGIYNIREKKGGEYLKSNYPELGKLDIVDKDSLKKGDLIDYNTLRKYLNNNDLVNPVHYQKVVAMIDEKSFIDYMAFMIYNGNIDWEGANHRSWKEKKVDAKWRWILDDIDYGFKYNDVDVNVNVNLFEKIKNSGSHTNMVLLFNGLLKNSTFKQSFKTRFNTLLATAFLPQSIQPIVNKIDDERKAYMSLEKAEWEISLSDYTQHISNVRLFVNARAAIVKAQLDAFIP